MAATKGKASGKRELIDTGTDKRFVRRDSQGQFKESDDVGRSLSMDGKRQAKTTATSGQGDRGDRKRAPAGASASSTSGFTSRAKSAPGPRRSSKSAADAKTSSGKRATSGSKRSKK